MSFHYTYMTRGTCSSQIDIDLEGDVIEKVVFTKGCKGNLEGMSRMVSLSLCSFLSSSFIC